MQCVHDCNLLFRDDDSLGMDSSAVVQRNREIPQSSASVIRYIQVVLVLVSSAFSQCARLCRLCLQPVHSALSALPSASALGFVGSSFSQCARLCRLFLQPVRSALSALPSASALGFVGSSFSQCTRLCRLFLQPVRSALSALPSASALGFVGSSFSQCTRLCYNIVPILCLSFLLRICLYI